MMGNLFSIAYSIDDTTFSIISILYFSIKIFSPSLSDGRIYDSFSIKFLFFFHKMKEKIPFIFFKSLGFILNKKILFSIANLSLRLSLYFNSSKSLIVVK